MDFSAANIELWEPIIQIGILAVLVLIANVLRRKVAFVRNSLMPTAVLAGFLLLILRSTGLLNADAAYLEAITYHTIALGFIALTLRTSEKQSESAAWIGAKSGALIVSTYLVQAITGLVISLALAYTIMPRLFKASGILLPMAYGQGPGQANNVGSTYEALGMAGGRSFGLSLAAMGYLCACIVGVIYINILNRKHKITKIAEKDPISGSVTIDTFQAHDEIPISESIDRLSIQAAMIVLIYWITYLLTHGITTALRAMAPGVAATVEPLLWGFNFIIASLVAILAKTLIQQLRKHKLMKRQYQNNYLLSRISGLLFDIMIVAGIGSINIEDLSGNWLPFILMAIAGGIVTFYYLKWICKKLYSNHFYESFLSMYGMLTGTISSGVLLLREIDPNLETPASDYLISGSSFGIAFGIPMLLLISFAAKGEFAVWAALGLIIIYLLLLILFMLKAGPKHKRK